MIGEMLASCWIARPSLVRLLKRPCQVCPLAIAVSIEW